MANYGPRRIQRSKSMIQERSSKDVGMGEKEHRKTDKGVDMMMTVEKVKRRRPHRANTPQSLQPTRAILVPSNQSNALVPIRSTRSHKEEGQVPTKTGFGSSLRSLLVGYRGKPRRTISDVNATSPRLKQGADTSIQYDECVNRDDTIAGQTENADTRAAETGRAERASSAGTRQTRKVSFQEKMAARFSRTRSSVEQFQENLRDSRNQEEDHPLIFPRIQPSGRSFNRAVFVEDDPFRILSVEPNPIGEGASGTVHRACAPNGQVMALKIIHKPSTHDENEVAIMQRVSHRALMRCYISFRWDGALHVAMDLMDGGSLYHYLTALRDVEGSMEEPYIAYIIKELLMGLSALHEEGIVHCDVKTDNVLISTNGTIKLADFGSAVVLEDRSKMLSRRGTPHWMAPEMALGPKSGAQVTTKADVWSLGIIAIELADWEPPLMNISREGVMQLHQKGLFPQPKIESRRSFLFQDFVYQCTETAACRRESCEGMLQHPFLALGCTREAMGSEFSRILARKDG